MRARVCVLACGANYALQRRLGLGMPRLMLQSAQMELPAERLGESKCISAPTWRRADSPGPCRSARRSPFVRVGVMCDGDAAGISIAMLACRRRAGASPAGAAQPRQKVLPLAPIGRTYGDRVLVLGDAAGS